MKRVFISKSNEQYIAVFDQTDPINTIIAYCCFSLAEVFNAQARYISFKNNILVADVKDYRHVYQKLFFSEIDTIPEKWLKKLQDANIEIQI